MDAGRADICFLAVDPAREEAVAFTAPYTVIEGVFAVSDDSPLTSAADVDRPGIRVAVKKGPRTTCPPPHPGSRGGGAWQRGTSVFAQQQEVAAGNRQPVVDFVATHRGTRLLEPRFMEIQQAVGTRRSRSEEAPGFLHAFVEELKANGFIAGALDRSGRRDAAVAPTAA